MTDAPRKTAKEAIIKGRRRFPENPKVSSCDVGIDTMSWLTPLEASVTHSICTQLENLGWVVDERRARNNVRQQRPKTTQQLEAIRRANEGRVRFPDFVLFETGTTIPIAVIEAKRPGVSLDQALEQATEYYAVPLDAPLVFAYNDTFVVGRHLHSGRALKIDGEDVRQFVDEPTCLRFVREGAELLSAPKNIHLSREQLIRVFKRQADLLREAGLQAGLDRFGALSDVLFLKLMDEICQLREHSGEPPPIPEHLRWSEWAARKPSPRLEFVRDVVWPQMNAEFGEVFGQEFPISSPDIFEDMVQSLSELNFTGTDADVKGDAFEYFLKNAYQGVGLKDLGEYFTPRNIVRTMVSMVNPVIGEKVYDPFCGTGGFMIEAFRYVEVRTKLNPQINKILKEETVFGSEISGTARVARMNMILYGDGHSNVQQVDSFSKPQNEKYDVVLTNPPFSQKTRYGSRYPLPSSNGDVIALQHCLGALSDGGRAAILIKDDFLSAGGTIGQLRRFLFNSAYDLNVVSLPRRLFEPYTPTKTSILYFRKGSGLPEVKFFGVRRVGHTLGARKQSIDENDLPAVLSAFQNGTSPGGGIPYASIGREEVIGRGHSLWMYDYLETLVGEQARAIQPLGKFVMRSGSRFKPQDFPDHEFRILGVDNQDGVFLNYAATGVEIKQPYIRVNAGDIVYNPHRVNVGSIGVVPDALSGGIVSGIYVVFRPNDSHAFPPGYLVRLLKTEEYLEIIGELDTVGAVRANLKWEQLVRIPVIAPNVEELKAFSCIQQQILSTRSQLAELERQADDTLSPLT